MKRPSFVLAIHPHYRGFGWIVFEGPSTPYNWGLVCARREKNQTCLKKLEWLLKRYEPETLVLEAFDRGASVRHARIARLCKSIVVVASDAGLEVAIYTRGQVRVCFSAVGASTRQEIAEAVGRRLEALRHLLPRRRQVWEAQCERMSLFSAAAVGLTHYTLGANDLFEQLFEAA